MRGCPLIGFLKRLRDRRRVASLETRLRRLHGDGAAVLLDLAHRERLGAFETALLYLDKLALEAERAKAQERAALLKPVPLPKPRPYTPPQAAPAIIIAPAAQPRPQALPPVRVDTPQPPPQALPVTPLPKPKPAKRTQAETSPQEGVLVDTLQTLGIVKSDAKRRAKIALKALPDGTLEALISAALEC